MEWFRVVPGKPRDKRLVRGIAVSPYEREIMEVVRQYVPDAGMQCKVRVADVLALDEADLTPAQRRVYMAGHFDIVLMHGFAHVGAIEVDGAAHELDDQQIQRDLAKDELCQMAGFPLLRINMPKAPESHSHIGGLLKWFWLGTDASAAATRDALIEAEVDLVSLPSMDVARAIWKASEGDEDIIRRWGEARYVPVPAPKLLDVAMKTSAWLMRADQALVRWPTKRVLNALTELAYHLRRCEMAGLDASRTLADTLEARGDDASDIYADRVEVAAKRLARALDQRLVELDEEVAADGDA